MKIKLSKLKSIIREEVTHSLNEVLASQDPDLDAYRKDAIRAVAGAAPSLKELAAEVLDLPAEEVSVWIIGSVLERNRFRDDSDVDVAFSVPGSEGLDEVASEAMQKAAEGEPIGYLGVVNTLVFRGPVAPKKGGSKRVA